MTEETSAPGGNQVAAPMASAEEASRAAHAARTRADDDAGYAYNAKLAAEEHSKAIAVFKGQAEADANWFTATKQGAEQAQAAIGQIKAEADAARQAIADAIPELEKARAFVRSAVEQSEGFREAAEKAGAEAAAHAKAAQTNKVNAEGFAEESEEASRKVSTIAEQLDEQAGKAQEHAVQIEEAAVAIAKADETAKGLVRAMTAASAKAAEVLKVIEQHEKDLGRLKGECTTLHTRIESLLPNATSAGLATAFRDQQARFVKPQRNWLVTFVVAIGALLLSSLVGLPSADGTWDQMAKHFINRLPLIAPLVWLAVYAGRHYGLALRLQEEYAYKEAVSAAFEGYKREMSTVTAVGDGSMNPLVTLCESVLRTLGQRPGRIYEGKHEDITALTPVAAALKDGAATVVGAAQGRLSAPTP